MQPLDDILNTIPIWMTIPWLKHKYWNDEICLSGKLQEERIVDINDEKEACDCRVVGSKSKFLQPQ